MATIRTMLTLTDGMTGPIQKIHRAMNTLMNSFESMQDVSGKAIDTASLQKARDLVADSVSEWDRLEDNVRGAGEAQEEFNNRMRAGETAADALGNKLNGILKTVASIAGIKTALNWSFDNMKLADTQRNAENQLAVVLANMGARDAEIPIKLKAAEIQDRGVYSDEIMLAGAAEFATYFSDGDAITSMMDTLSNYAMGMSATEGRGLELDSAAMVQFATNLGKIRTGAYDAMTQKGFEFTDAQKAIIEGTATEAQIVDALGAEYLDLSADMQAAAAINSVIAESWGGLYDAMSSTPEGQILQFKHSLDAVREELGNRLYPAALHFVDAFTERFPQVEQVMGNLANACSVLIGILTAAAVMALNTATAISDNWGWLGPIILGVAGAVLVYNGALLAYNTVQGISNAIQAISTLQSRADALAKKAQAGATLTAAESQTVFNAALLACPITWIVIGIIAIIAAIYAAVGAINHFAGTSYSATGIIMGAFAVLGAFILNNSVIPLYNNFAALGNFLGNVFNDPVAAVKVLFYDMALTVIGYISNMAHAIEDVINKIPGVSVDITSGLDNFYNGLEEAQQKVKDESGWVEYVQKREFIDYSDAARAGYNFGAGIENKISGLFDFGSLDTSDFANIMDGIYSNTGDTAANTAAAANALDYTEEDLKYMRDIAEREAINRFTTAEIHIEQTNNNNISSTMDLDGVIDNLTDSMREAIDMSAEGIHE